MSAWDLPQSMNINGREWEVRTDYRAILDILMALQSDEYEKDEKLEIALTIFYVDFEEMNIEEYTTAYQLMSSFIDMGIESDERIKPKTMDWEQDAPYIIAGINRVTGKEIRALDYMHWWTFLSSYMEIGEGAFSTIISIRQKKIKGKKLEKWEKEFYQENKKAIDLQTKYTEEEKQEQDYLKALLDG